MTVREILQKEALFQDKDAAFRQLEGGLVNQSYRVSDANREYYLRIHSTQGDYLGLDRRLEEEAYKAAGRLGISPAVYDTAGTGYLITDFFPGKHLNEKEIHKTEILRQVVGIVKTIHTKMDIPRTFSAFDLIDGYLKWIREFRVPLPPGFGQIIDRVERIRYQRSFDKKYSHVFCHNDVWKNNLLYNGKIINIVDWELCGYGDAYFDLARIPYLEHSTVEEETWILTEYFGYFDMEMWNTLQQMKYVGMVSEAVWAFFHSAIERESQNSSLDYTEFANHVVDILAKGENHF